MDPCSHVGHVFRKVTPHTWPEMYKAIAKNTLRTVETWADEYKGFYYKLHAGGDGAEELGSTYCTCPHLLRFS